MGAALLLAAALAGVYWERRAFQPVVLAVAAALASMVAPALIVANRAAGWAARGALAATVGLVLIRVAGVVSLHETDALLGQRVGPTTLGDAAQGALLVLIAAMTVATATRLGKLWTNSAAEDAGASTRGRTAP